MKKLSAVMLFVFVAMLAAGAAFAYDTKVIDEATNLDNLHNAVRPIAHLGTGAAPLNRAPGVDRYSPRMIGFGYTVEDTSVQFYTVPAVSVVGVSDTLNTNYIGDKRTALASGGGNLMNLHQAESTAVWRAIPMPTGQMVPTGLGHRWMSTATLMNNWDPNRTTGAPGYGAWYGNSTRTPDAAPTSTPRYGYAVPRVEARAIANSLFANPGTNNVTGEFGQETMTSVFVWSADKNTGYTDAAGVTGNPSIVAVMVRLDNDLYKGMKVSDLNVIKVKGTSGHQVFTRVDSASALRGGHFAVVHRSATAVRDVVVGPDHIIQAGSRAGSDPEWNSMQYFVLLGVEKGSVFDSADAAVATVVGDPAIIVANRPFVKTPNLSLPLATGVNARFGWVRGNRANAQERYDGFTRDPFVADGIWGVAARDRYTATAQAAMMTWNQMNFVSDAVVDRYGFAAERAAGNIYKLPAVRANDVPTGKTALVMYTIRVGAGEMELPAANFVGKTPADIRVIDVRSDVAPAEMTEFTLATSVAELTDGRFAILKPNAFARHEQDVMAANEAFVADGVYFVALAVKDNGAFDIDTSNPLSNNESWVSPAFLVLGGGVGPTPSPTPDPSPTPSPTPDPVSGSSGGGCSVGGFAPATLLLLAPLFLLLKK